MALSLSNFLYDLLLLLLPLGLIVGSNAESPTVTYDWDVTWVNRNPDGLAERPVISLNGEWPWPLLNITKGSRVIANVHNKLGNQSTSIHFHGLYQNGTNDMDGPVGVVQCDIPAGGSMTYNFTIDQPGTYWYHSHTRGQYPDGARGQFIVADPDSPYRDQIDEEVAFTLSDWYHEEMAVLLPQFISYKNPTGAEPIPNSAVMNDTQNMTVPVRPGRTYFFRVSNIAAFAGQYFWIEDHELTIIQVDGVWTKPAKTKMLYLTTAQRYGFLVTMKDDASRNYPMVGAMDETYFDVIPAALNPNVTGWLMYDDSAAKPKPALVGAYDPYDDFTLVPYDELKLLEGVGKTIELHLQMETLDNGANYAFFNNITYVTPVVPTLYSVLSSGAAADKAEIYGSYTNSHILDKGDVVEIILNSNDAGKHPFHLHGHDFQAVYRSGPDGGHYDREKHHNLPAVPMRRDTLMVRPNGNFAIRWVADNPGVWFFHCHIDWHLATGLAAVMIEAPLDLQSTLRVPQQHYDNCKALGVPYEGNAAGNTVDLFDLTGQNKAVPHLPAGFTAKGYVALVFSVVSAVLGMIVISWYGAAPLGNAELASAKNFLAKAGGSTG